MIEQENHHSKYQNKKLERANENIKKLLSTNNEEISQLKNHNQDLKDKIERFEDNKESPYRSDNDLEEDIKHLNTFIMDKDDELTQIQRKLKVKNQRYVDINNRKEELQQKYDDTKQKHKLEIAKINGNFASNTENYFDLEFITRHYLRKSRN